MFAKISHGTMKYLSLIYCCFIKFHHVFTPEFFEFFMHPNKERALYPHEEWDSYAGIWGCYVCFLRICLCDLSLWLSDLILWFRHFGCVIWLMWLHDFGCICVIWHSECDLGL